MKKYAFLFRPLFFIFNLLFATWLVLTIEKLKPTDFGRHGSIFENTPKARAVSKSDKQFLMNLSGLYRAGIIDSAELDKELERFLTPVK